MMSNRRFLESLFWFYALALFFYGLVFTSPVFVKIFSLDGALCSPTIQRLHYLKAAFLSAGAICALPALRLRAKRDKPDLPERAADILAPATFLIFLLFSIEGLLAVRFYPSYLPSDADEPLALEDKNLGYRLNPSHDDIYKINRYGFRGREPVLDAGKKNIYCVGDSITFGLELTDESAPYPERLQRILYGGGFHALNVVNAGTPGYASLNALRYIESDIIPAGRPALIIYCAGQNDLHESLWGTWRPNTVNQYIVLKRSPSAIFEFVKFLSQRFHKKGAQGAHYRVSDKMKINKSVQNAALAQFKDDLIQTVNLCRKNNIPLLVLNIPTVISEVRMTDAERAKAGVFTAEALKPFEDTIGDICRENAVAAESGIFNLNEADKNSYFWDHCHLTPKGAAEMAERVSAALIKHYPRLLTR